MEKLSRRLFFGLIAGQSFTSLADRLTTLERTVKVYHPDPAPLARDFEDADRSLQIMVEVRKKLEDLEDRVERLETR